MSNKVCLMHLGLNFVALPKPNNSMDAEVADWSSTFEGYFSKVEFPR